IRVGNPGRFSYRGLRITRDYHGPWIMWLYFLLWRRRLEHLTILRNVVFYADQLDILLLPTFLHEILSSGVECFSSTNLHLRQFDVVVWRVDPGFAVLQAFERVVPLGKLALFRIIGNHLLDPGFD